MHVSPFLDLYNIVYISVYRVVMTITAFRAVCGAIQINCAEFEQILGSPLSKFRAHFLVAVHRIALKFEVKNAYHFSHFTFICGKEAGNRWVLSLVLE